MTTWTRFIEFGTFIHAGNPSSRHSWPPGRITPPLHREKRASPEQRHRIGREFGVVAYNSRLDYHRTQRAICVLALTAHYQQLRCSLKASYGC